MTQFGLDKCIPSWYTNNMKRTTIRLGSQVQAATRLAEQWGLEGQATALRLALRVVAQTCPAVALPGDLHTAVGRAVPYALDAIDLAAAQTIAAAYGLSGVSAASRVALYLVATCGLALRSNPTEEEV